MTGGCLYMDYVIIAICMIAVLVIGVVVFHEDEKAY